MGFHHNDIQWGAVGTGFEHCDVQFGRTWSAAALAQSNKNANVTWGASPNYWSCADTNDWARAEWKVTPTDSRGNGNIRVTVRVDSGSAPILKIMAPTWNDPHLTENTSSPYGTVTAGNDYVFTGTAPKVYQTGYFNMTTGWTSYNMSAHITKIEWQVATNGYQTIWEESAAGSFNHSCVRFG
jgi:hypothetical protein